MADKVRGVVDIVFLMDATGSMGKCIDALKMNLQNFFNTMTSTEGNGSPVKDWRAKVVGFRDYEEDGPANWLENNPFVTSLDDLNRQLSGITAVGGGDEPESLLDALFTVINVGATGLQESPDPNKWRPRSAAARVVVIFTDASYKETMSIPEAAGLNIDTLFNFIEKERIVLSIFAPDLPCYDTLCTAPRSEYTPAAGAGLDSLTSDPKSFSKLMQQLAKSVSQSASVVAV